MALIVKEYVPVASTVLALLDPSTASISRATKLPGSMTPTIVEISVGKYVSVISIYPVPILPPRGSILTFGAGLEVALSDKSAGDPPPRKAPLKAKETLES